MTRLNLRRQFILLFTILIIPVFIVNLYGNRQAESILKGNVTEAYVELIKQNRQLLNRDLDTVNRVSSTIMLHPATQHMAPDSEDTVRQRIDKYQELDKLMNNYSLGVNGGQAVYYYFFVHDPDNLYHFAPKAPLATIERAGVYFFSDEYRPEWYEAALDNKGKGMLMSLDHFGAGSKRTVAYVRAVNDITDRNHGLIGVLVAAGMEKKLGESLPSVTTLEGEVYLTDWSNRILASTVKDTLGESLPLPPEAASPSSASGTISTAASQSMYIMDYSYAIQQKLIYKVPLGAMLSKQRGLKQVLTLTFIVYGVFILVIIAYLWRSLVNPLRKMALFAQAYEPGQLVPDVPQKGRKDEIGVLLVSLYEMAKRLNGLVHDKYQMEIREREAQLQLLYQQINPHLLYNTLESIYWKSVQEGNSNAAEMIKELSVLMKIGLSRGKELIELQQELFHAQAYVKLQQKRYEYTFQVYWHIDESSMDTMIPKITLQPLIENAIIHGVRYMQDEGIIAIRATAEGEDIVITVTDNGFKPVDYEAIEKLLEDEQSSRGYGIRNIHQRIQLHYGNNYGLTYGPGAVEGTCVTVRLPRSLVNEAVRAEHNIKESR